MARIVEESYLKDLCTWIINCENAYEIDISRTLAEIKEDLENMQEIVRCKDCKYYDERYEDCNHPALWFEYCSDVSLRIEPDDFCSYGERRTDV